MTTPPPPFTPFRGARIAVVGLGRAGLPAALRLAEWGAEVEVWDDTEAAREVAAEAGLTVRDPAQGRFRADALLLSPGIPHRLPQPHPAARAAEAAGAPILCDAEFLYRAVLAAHSGARFVGVTGTNGKSTTTALIHHLLTRAGREAAVGGNLGPAALSLNILGSEGIYTLEMSSYMLERIATLRFNVAVMLNLSADHLDRHGDMAGYAAAKARIFAQQQREDVAVLGQDDAPTRAMAARTAARVVPVSGVAPQPGGVWAEGRRLRDDAGEILDLGAAPALPGSHNAQNAAAAAAAGFALGLTRAEIALGLASFAGLPHRQERVAEARGVLFVNDSKATNADSAARALASYDRVVWIAGGIAKEGGIESLAPLLRRVAHAVLIGRDAPRLAATLAAHGVPHEIAGTLEDALPRAADIAFAGAAPVVLLSPACASFDQFSGFDARGDRFRALVRAIAEGDA
ncbi:UDP-N-acetylmuramoyl-L-alanine--D-glutamate ligase [Roseomonas alkaliterrae]|uniref:UDP-N-acetylmuramoylalanine--D-glutamate ligase n=1 Tax=Neoroseomonas alkaliterrae TaxID=1452450 RepID=A0A840XYX7_9PROT|nr:UDP-N-acetylmuramoyl-L-alanine--D-glutamate ligase [Neoroseomonas alkaliterrae]MBB5689001.1 UDP-N-acetylmuramoylalanine--D-glutamate ligase [Neoroseomonas alkaliterrae]MBR0674876.1 UDP-N-acetylmuramoyl-L-alanine--D-glutamate ligase [Neoroseomonas alkaliterrae]